MPTECRNSKPGESKKRKVVRCEKGPRRKGGEDVQEKKKPPKNRNPDPWKGTLSRQTRRMVPFVWTGGGWERRKGRE